jgi:hypothetical protein
MLVHPYISGHFYFHDKIVYGDAKGQAPHAPGVYGACWACPFAFNQSFFSMGLCFLKPLKKRFQLPSLLKNMIALKRLHLSG